AADRLPYATAGGATYDSGDYAKALDNLLEVSAYRTLRTEQARRRERGDRVQLGIGLSVYVEVTAVGIGPEWGAVRIETDGTATVRCGTTSFGKATRPHSPRSRRSSWACHSSRCASSIPTPTP